MAASSPSIYLATPCYGGLAHAAYMSALLALRPACQSEGVGLYIDLSGGEALIGRGRAVTMTKFLASDATHLLFIDADIGFVPDDVFRLLASNKDVVGGAYPRKAPGRGDELDDLPAGSARQEGSLRTLASVGTGFLLISRAAARRMTDGYPQLRASLVDMPSAGVPETVMVFDSLIDPATRAYLSDYQAFCHRWRALGGEVWVDENCRPTHVSAVSESAGS
ncbi:MAG TPA: hypothetical protein VHN73_04785 [Phenylobacterium sp.]|nr:hypothetical protein [Phenylobacterium sp.]